MLYSWNKVAFNVISGIEKYLILCVNFFSYKKFNGGNVNYRLHSTSKLKPKI